MPHINTVVQSPVFDSFRVRQVAGLFDVPISSKSSQSFDVQLPGLDQDWLIGAIVGPSGSGKSTIANKAFGKNGCIAPQSLTDSHDWPHDKAVVDGFDQSLPGKHVTAMLNAVGFSSPPAWIRPWHVLSNGEKFRCDLAHALLKDQQVIAFDEFTSVVDRQVARFGSAAVAKTLRAGRAKCQRFVAVTCHYDILQWLEPDWWLDMADSTLHWGSVRRPDIQLKIHACKKNVWGLFKHHHYLSSTLNNASRCYIATWDDKPVAFCSTLHLYGHSDMRIIHRLVVLPDFQGLGVGPALLDEVAKIEAKNMRVTIVTSHPALIRSLSRNPKWRCANVVKCGQAHKGILARTGKKIGSMGRITASFRYRKTVA
ncbi:GNAT family N-acetyltransferase [bacterium AH-315-I18]|nr:GNAT family N-acetyltransferase [Phycisphaeraceae bacterium]MBN4061077.1 GNAT family N-acetyltransferase [bacterium AH-315-I18]